MSFKSIRPYDRIILDGRMWSVASVEYGGERQEDAVEIVCADGTITNGVLRVPLALIPAASIYREVEHSELAVRPR